MISFFLVEYYTIKTDIIRYYLLQNSIETSKAKNKSA